MEHQRVPSLGRLQARQSGRLFALYILSGILLVTLSCNLTAPVQDLGLDKTRAVVDSQITTVAKQNEDNMHATSVALDVKSTVIALQQNQLAQASTAAAVPTQPPPPTDVPPTAVPPTNVPASTQVPPAPVLAVPTSAPTPDVEAMIKNANILLYEDIAGYYDLTRWVQTALNQGGYKYTDVGDAVGNFKSELLSGKKWDLIIAAAEARKGIQGEFFEYLSSAANKDVGVIIEIWYLDLNAGAPVSSILSNCGVTFQKNWLNPDRNSRSVVWLDPEFPLFHEPNEGISLVHYSPYWTGDAGDLLMKKSSGTGDLLAGLYTSEKSRYGVLSSCMDGRVIVQTFSTHDYFKDDMVRLWQNYIHYTLKNHFIKVKNLK